MRFFSDAEIDKILRETYRIRAIPRSDAPNLLDALTALGFLECQEYAEHIEGNTLLYWGKCFPLKYKRVNAILGRLSCITGNVKNNPEGLYCPECESRYVAEIFCYDYLEHMPEQKDTADAASKQTPYDEITEPLKDNNGNPYFGNENRYICLACGNKWGKFAYHYPE